MSAIGNTSKQLVAAALFVGVAVLLYALAPPISTPNATADKVLILKRAHQMVLFRNDVPLETYTVSLGRSLIGPKTRAGDHKTPEGNYVLDWRNPQSKFHLSLHISYPNPRDMANAQQAGVQPGGDIMIHGLQNRLGWIGRFHRFVDWTDGCVAVIDAEMNQIWRAVPDGTPLEIRP